MPPNFWAEMIAVGVGFLLPELIIELIIMLIVGLTGGTAFPALAARAGVFLAKLRKLGKTVKAADVLAEIVKAFKNIASGLARIGRALRKLLDDVGEAAAGGVARIRRQLNQYTVEIDPNTLGMNGGNIKIVRKSLGKQVPYGSTQLSQAAQAHRRQNNITGKTNVAVFEYVDEKGNLQTLAMESNRGVGHAERRAAKALEEMGVPPDNVRSIYSELAPCNMPGGYCEGMIRRTFPTADVSYSFEYGSDKESRTRGLDALGDAVGSLFGN